MVENLSNERRKTKIIVTLGETSSSKAVLVDLINASMDVARISNRFLKARQTRSARKPQRSNERNWSTSSSNAWSPQK